LFVVDTNVLIDAANDQSPHHKQCRALLEGWRAQPAAWFLTWGICYEFLRACTSRHVLRPAWTANQAWSFLEPLLASRALGILVPTDRHPAVLADVLQRMPSLAGTIIHDVHTAVLMREHGLKRIYTRDTDFHRFAFLEPADPTREGGA